MNRYFRAAIAAALLVGFGAVAQADYQVRDGNGNIITIKSGTTGAGSTLPQSNPSDAFGNSMFTITNPGQVQPVGPAPDIRPATPAQITIVDTGSATAAGQNGASIVSGTATANSAAALTLNGQTTSRVEVNGTWSGTLQFEASVDNGTTWVPHY